jgi:hypothetical protein
MIEETKFRVGKYRIPVKLNYVKGEIEVHSGFNRSLVAEIKVLSGRSGMAMTSCSLGRSGQSTMMHTIIFSFDGSRARTHMSDTIVNCCHLSVDHDTTLLRGTMFFRMNIRTSSHASS